MLIITQEEGRKPGGLCRKVDETDKRFYVDVVRTGQANHPNDSYYAGHVQGRADSKYVAKEYVLAVNVTEGQYEEYLVAFAAWGDAKENLRVEYERQLALAGLSFSAQLGALFEF